MSFAFMPLYSGDYLRDTRHLTPLRHGVYLLLLMHCWDSRGPVPLDEQEAAGISNCRSADEVEALRYVLARFFVRMEDGWYNKRIQSEIERAENISRARSQAGRLGYEAKAKHLPSKSSASASTPTTTITTTATEKHESFALSSSLSADDSEDDSTTKTHRRSGAYIAPRCPTEQLIELYHKHLPMLPRCEVISPKRKTSLSARWREVCVEDKVENVEHGTRIFESIFSRAARSKFLTGKKTDWRATFDWLIAPTNFVKVVEGSYDDGRRT